MGTAPPNYHGCQRLIWLPSGSTIEKLCRPFVDICILYIPGMSNSCLGPSPLSWQLWVISFFYPPPFSLFFPCCRLLNSARQQKQLMFARGAAARREEPPRLIRGLGAEKRPPGRRPPLFHDYALSSRVFPPLSWRPPQKCSDARRVPMHACARARVCAPRFPPPWATPATARATAPVGSRSVHFPVPIMFPSATPCQRRAPPGKPPRTWETFAGSQGPGN